MRGPLEVLKEGWVEHNGGGDDIISYVTHVYDRLQEAREIAQRNLKMTQGRLKTWYDQKAREMQLQEDTATNQK